MQPNRIGRCSRVNQKNRSWAEWAKPNQVRRRSQAEPESQLENRSSHNQRADLRSRRWNLRWQLIGSTATTDRIIGDVDLTRTPSSRSRRWWRAQRWQFEQRSAACSHDRQHSRSRWTRRRWTIPAAATGLAQGRDQRGTASRWWLQQHRERYPKRMYAWEEAEPKKNSAMRCKCNTKIDSRGGEKP
jgi:hypothetical protein